MEIKRILVVGSGIMGRGIAYASAIAGYQTILNDISADVLANAKKEIEKILQEGVSRGKITHEQSEQALNNLTLMTDLPEAAKQADFVIEAVPEDMNIKKAVFEQLDAHTAPHVILATNTSTMSPTEIGSYTNRPDKVIAMHFFNPVHKMKLVEIIRGLETSDDTADTVKQVAVSMGKETVMINEFPGFVTSRISSLVGNEAFYMLMEGVGTPEEIDRAIELGLNYPMGPFKLGDLVGLDTRLKNLEYLHKTLGERFRPCPLLVKYVKAGRLGRKTGKGVYDYTHS
jgi:3-hydroxybutyryl-CoA dehydrogenase